MKRSLSIFLFFVLTGCTSVFDSYVFDQTEYFQYSKLMSDAQLSAAHCSDPVYMEKQVLPELEKQAYTLVLYTKHRSTVESQKASAILNNFVVEMRAAYSKTPPPTKTYCELKLDVIARGADRVMSSLSKL